MQIIDGKLVAKLTREDIARQVGELPQDKLGKIGLAVILVGDDPASKVYVRNKINGCAEVGIASTLVTMPADASFEEVADKIKALNADPEVSGILLQLPVPKHLNEAELLHLIDPAKDVDGCHYVQKGKLWTGEPDQTVGSLLHPHRGEKRGGGGTLQSRGQTTRAAAARPQCHRHHLPQPHP